MMEDLEDSGVREARRIEGLYEKGRKIFRNLLRNKDLLPEERTLILRRAAFFAWQAEGPTNGLNGTERHQSGHKVLGLRNTINGSKVGI